MLAPIEQYQREVQFDREDLQRLAQRGKDPTVHVRWTQARGWEIADQGRFREQVRACEEQERQRERGRDRGWDRGR